MLLLPVDSRCAASVVGGVHWRVISKIKVVCCGGVVEGSLNQKPFDSLFLFWVLAVFYC